MTSEYNKNDFLSMGRAREIALAQIARKLGKNHAITKMMGVAAWGRSDFETGPEPKLRDAIEWKAGLDGMFCILNMWARDHDSAAQRVMLNLYPRGYKKANDFKKEK